MTPAFQIGDKAYFTPPGPAEWSQVVTVLEVLSYGLVVQLQDGQELVAMGEELWVLH